VEWGGGRGFSTEGRGRRPKWRRLEAAVPFEEEDESLFVGLLQVEAA